MLLDNLHSVVGRDLTSMAEYIFGFLVISWGFNRDFFYCEDCQVRAAIAIWLMVAFSVVRLLL